MKELSLDIVIQTQQDIVPVVNFLEKKGTLEVLNIGIWSGEISKSAEIIQTLLKTIDDLPELKTLNLKAKSKDRYSEEKIFFYHCFCKR